MTILLNRKRKRNLSPSNVINCFYQSADIPQALDELSDLLDGVPNNDKIALLLTPELLSRLSIWYDDIDC